MRNFCGRASVASRRRRSRCVRASSGRAPASFAPASHARARGPTPAGRRRWRARSARAVQRSEHCCLKWQPRWRHDDGTWSIWFDGPADLSVTVEAYAALKLAGVDAGDATRRYIQRAGGVRKTRIFTRAFLALIGQWPWHRLSHVPVELILLPAQGPLSVYDFACWARQTMVALSVVEALQPVRPSRIDLSEIGGRKTEPGRTPHLSPLRRRAVKVAERWVRERQ